MHWIHAETALMPDGMRNDVRVGFSETGIECLETGVPPVAGDERHSFLLPAVANLHSHAFQRAMAGLAETRSRRADDFWSWRGIMYRFAGAMTPEQAEAVAAQLYVEMLEAGFCRVGEFHYLHHGRDGVPYDDPAEMAGRIAAAADETGIALTLLPVFYAHAGFGGASPDVGQRRFVSDLDLYARMVERCRSLMGGLRGGVLGAAPHSLRAVTPEELRSVVDIAGSGPIHIHVAEQEREVEECVAWCGTRPVRWLLDNVALDRRWCLIHATHVDGGELRGMAASGITAGLCPVTEANLGDGVFPAEEFLDAGGRFGIGTDSNVLVSLRDEIRMLEYSQRLHRRRRNVVAEDGGSTGARLIGCATEGGAASLGSVSGIEAGRPADLLALDLSRVPWLQRERVLDHFAFASGIEVDALWVGGSKRVEGGRHRHRERIAARFGAVMAELVGRDVS